MPLEFKQHLCKRKSKISLTEAYNSLHHYNIIALSQTMLDSTISSEYIYIEGFSREIYCSDHSSNSKIGEVCLYFRNELVIKQRRDIELTREPIVCEINVSCKKIIFITVYRSPCQNSEQFDKIYANHDKSVANGDTSFNCNYWRSTLVN